MDAASFARGARSAGPVCLGVVPVGISFGLIALQSGLDQAQTVAMSVLVMAGSAQLMAVSMLGAAAPAAIILAVFLVNLRHFVMGSAVMERLRRAPLGLKLLSSFALCDESFAVFSLSGGGDVWFLLGANTALYLVWVGSTAVGALVGDFLPEFVAKGFGVAFYASFLALLAPVAKGSRAVAGLVVLTAAVSTALGCVLPSSWAVIVAMVGCAWAATYFAEGDAS